MNFPSTLRLLLPLPAASDNKYTRGTVGFVTGSEAYPGAALLGISAAQQTGVGMVRYLGPRRVGDLVLVNAPEVIVTDEVLNFGRAQAYVLGSGIDARDEVQSANLRAVGSQPIVAVVDAGALAVLDFGQMKDSSLLLTPHHGEAMAMLNRHEGRVRWLPERFDEPEYRMLAAQTLVDITGQSVLLKGSTTLIITHDGRQLEVGPNSPFLATAGTGDVLAGILGGIAAQNSHLAFESWLEIAHLAVLLHSRAAEIASRTATPTASSVASAVFQAMAETLNR